MDGSDFSSNDAGQTSAGSTTGSGLGSSDGQGFADRARDIAGSAQEKLADVGSSVRDRAGHLKDSLADALDAGADKLRQRGASMHTSSPGDLAGATDTGSVTLGGDGRSTQVTNRVAGGMAATADWIRDADLDGMKTSIERQVKEHPGRSLLIAVGVGYLLGKIVRGK